MNQNKIIRVAGYIRVSTVVQATEGESLDVQKKQIEAHCKAKNWSLIKIYEDAGVSGSKAEKRQAFMNMSRDAKKREFDIVLFTKLSRFARNARDYYNYQHDFEEHGIALVSIKENIDPTSHNGRLMAGIFALLADWEREMIREQMTENKMVKWRDKRMFTGHAPYGYYWDKKACEFKENKDESKVLKLVFNWYTKLGFSMRDIVQELHKEGYRGRRVKWTNGSLSSIMKNPCYSACKLVTNTRVYVDSKRTKELKPESEWIIFDLPRIVPKSLCDRVKKRRTFNISKQKRTLWQENHWLRGTLFCGHCGGKMRVNKGNKRKDGTFPKYYVCHWACCAARDLKIESREKCIQRHIPVYDLEHYTWDFLCFSLTGAYLDTEKEKEFQEKAKVQFSFLTGGNVNDRIEDIESKVKRLQGEHQRKELANNRLLDLFENDGMDIRSLGPRLRENEQAMATLSEDIITSQNNLLELRQLMADQESYFNSRDVLFEIWSDLQDFSSVDKKRLLESLVPDGITVTTRKNTVSGKARQIQLGPENVCMEIVWNPLIFKHFEEKGKFPSLGQNGSDHSTGNDHG